MKLGIFRTSQSTPPPGVDAEMWDAVQRGCRHRYEGPTENEPVFITPQLAQLRADLTRQHHEDPELVKARRALDEALVELRLATNHQQSVDTETSLRIQAGRSARHRSDDPNAPHLRSDGARADQQLIQARQRRQKAEESAEHRNVALQTVTGGLADRMLVVARAALPRLHQYIALLSAERARAGHPPLPNLPPQLPEHLVLEACRRAGEPDPD